MFKEEDFVLLSESKFDFVYIFLNLFRIKIEMYEVDYDEHEWTVTLLTSHDEGIDLAAIESSDMWRIVQFFNSLSLKAKQDIIRNCLN